MEAGVAGGGRPWRRVEKAFVEKAGVFGGGRLGGA